jgi:hypothetical protein
MKNSLRSWPLTEPGSVIIWDDTQGRDHPAENPRQDPRNYEFLTTARVRSLALPKGYQVRASSGCDSTPASSPSTYK